MNKAVIETRVRRTHWFQNFELVPGVWTRGVSNVQERTPLFQIPADLSGQRVLDVGCADGYFSFLAESRGATVVAVDSWPSSGFLLAREALGSRVELLHMSVYDIDPAALGMFDLVFFFGVYYHLKNPLLALERIASVTRDCALVESEIASSHAAGAEGCARFYEHDELNGDPTNWWVPDVPCLLRTVRASGFPSAELLTCYDTRRAIVRARKGPRTAGRMLTDDFFIAIETPQPDDPVGGRVSISGWALSQLEPEGGIERITVYLDGLDHPASQLGEAEYGGWREDLAARNGSGYGRVGFRFTWDAAGTPAGRHTLHVLAEGRRGWNFRSVPVVCA